MTRSRDPSRPLPLSNDVVLILLAVASRPRHGYGIIREVAERTDGTVVLQTGALYRTLRRLLDAGFIVVTAPPSDEVPGDERRRYYAPTAYGRAVLDAEVERMARLVRAARLSIAGKRPRLA